MMANEKRAESNVITRLKSKNYIGQYATVFVAVTQ